MFSATGFFVGRNSKFSWVFSLDFLLMNICFLSQFQRKLHVEDLSQTIDSWFLFWFYEFQLTLVQVRVGSSLCLARLPIAVLVLGFLSCIDSWDQREKEEAGAM